MWQEKNINHARQLSSHKKLQNKIRNATQNGNEFLCPPIHDSIASHHNEKYFWEAIELDEQIMCENPVEIVQIVSFPQKT